MRSLNFLLYITVIVLLLNSCAKRGTVTGGDKDVLPPKISNSYPANYSVNFNKKTIKIMFNEYIQIKDLQKNLIVSPVMKNPVTILPQTGVSKQLIIKLNDTLVPNTTYSINFGQSIADYNEGNKIKGFKYVFSTGKQLDSLTVEGIIKDSYQKEVDKYVNVMLYAVEDNYNDSIVYKQTPRYITNTLDSLTTFKFENVKAGKYKLIALKEKGDNYKFDSKKDKIGFYNKIITVPDASVFELELFKETPTFKVNKPTQASANRVIMGYQGDTQGMTIAAKLKKENLPIHITKYPEKDSIQVWFAPIKNDSIQLQVKNQGIDNNFNVILRNFKKDTLHLDSKKTGLLNFNDSIIIHSNTPLTTIEKSKILLFKKDSAAVAFSTIYDQWNQDLTIAFNKEENQEYVLSVLPNAIVDYLGNPNKKIDFKYQTGNYTDYGNLKIELKNVQSYPVIIELTNQKGEVLQTAYTDKNPTVEFLNLPPNLYMLRTIYDVNKNKQRDSGIYLQNKQPEQVIYFEKPIDVRANWDINQEVDLGK